MALQAYDGVHSTTSTFVVEVIDENDNAPHFEKNFYDVAVEKNLPVGRRIAAVAARDMDFGSNGMISYNFSRYSNLFQINSSDGILLYDVFKSSIVFCSKNLLSCTSLVFFFCVKASLLKTIQNIVVS